MFQRAFRLAVHLYLCTYVCACCCCYLTCLLILAPWRGEVHSEEQNIPTDLVQADSARLFVGPCAGLKLRSLDDLVVISLRKNVAMRKTIRRTNVLSSGPFSLGMRRQGSAVIAVLRAGCGGCHFVCISHQRPQVVRH